MIQRRADGMSPAYVCPLHLPAASPQKACDPMDDSTDSPSDKMRASPSRLRDLAARLAKTGEEQMVELVRHAADELERGREPTHSKG